jgi:ABC-type antimicrobial peptide transport system permease subunit
MQTFHDRSLELWVLKAGGKMFTLLGVLALALAVVGVYGVKSYLVSQRTREIGIRMALGAESRDVLWMMLREGLALTGAGLAVGVPLAALVSLGLSKVLYDVIPFDPVVFASAPAVLAITALVASVLPARRATRIAPVRALRAE